jgi:hypothetical protein
MASAVLKGSIDYLTYSNTHQPLMLSFVKISAKSSPM